MIATNARALFSQVHSLFQNLDASHQMFFHFLLKFTQLQRQSMLFWW